jgi:hypothetical protein
MKRYLLLLFCAMAATSQVTLKIYQEPGHILVPAGGVVSNGITLVAEIQPRPPTAPTNIIILVNP